MAGELDVLRRLKSMSNMTGAPQMSDRSLSIVGQDPLDFSDDELKPVQEAADTQTGAYGFTPSRESLRNAGLSNLRRTVGLGDIAQRRQLEQIGLKGDYALAGDRVQADAVSGRAALQQDQQNQRMNATQQAIMDRLNLTIGATNARQEDAQQFKVDHPTESAGAHTVSPSSYSAVQKAQSGYDGLLSRAGRAVGFDGGRSALESSLTAVLDKKGTLNFLGQVRNDLANVPGSTIDERIQNSGQPGFAKLDPYERKYLALQLGM